MELKYGSGVLGISRKETTFLQQVVQASWAILFLAIIYQAIFYPEIQNLVAMTAVVCAWIIATKIWLQSQMLEKYLISSFTILGYAASQFYFPLLFTTLENKPLIYNLEIPEQVFLHSSLCLLVLVVAHAAYRLLRRFSLNRPVSILRRAGFFDPPSHVQIWLIGFFGMASSFYVYFTSPDIGREVTGAASDKLLQGLVPFSYAPFFIPLGKLFGNNRKPHKGYLLMIIGYAILLFAVSIARNSRGAFIFGLTSPAFGYAIGLLLGVFKTRILTLRNVVVVGFVGWLLLGPFTDLGTAMLLVRGNREDIPPSELLTLTLEALDDKKAIQARKDDDKSESMDFDWDERYLDNLFTARFANIKFNDSNLVTYSKVGEYDPDMQDYSVDQFLAVLPDPIIKLFDLDVDKETILSLSFGDYLYVLSGGFGTPGGFRIGNLSATGMATFGWWYLPLFGLVAIPLFYLNDKLFRANKITEPQAEEPENKFQLSFCGILALTTFFQFFLIESLVQAGTYLIRGYIQMLILYFLMFHVSRIVSLLFASKKRGVRWAHH